MRSILKLLGANIRHKKGAFAGIIILMMLITVSYTVTLSNNRNLKETLVHDYEAQGFGDWIVPFLEDDEFSGDIEKLSSYPEITKVSRVELSSFIPKSLLADGKETEDFTFMLPDSDAYALFNADLTEFVPHTALKSGEVYLAYGMHLSPLYAVGKELRITCDDGSEEVFTVRGYVQSVRYYSNSAFLCREDFDRLAGKHVISRLFDLSIFLKAGTDEGALREKLRNDLEMFRSPDIRIETAEDFFNSEMLVTATGTRILGVFVVLLVAIVLIVLINSITTAVETDYENLGILKANGFSKQQLRLVWILQYLFALLIGTVLGLLISVPLTAYFTHLFMSISPFLTSTRIALGQSLLISGAVMLLCTLFAFLATARICRISPVRAISGGRSEVCFDSRLQIGIRRRGMHFLTALRQFTSRLKSYLGCTLIAALLVFFLCTVSFLTRGINSDLFALPSGDVEMGILGEDNETIPQERLDRVVAIAKKYDAAPEFFTMASPSMTIEQESQDIPVYAFSEEWLYYQPVEGRLAKYDNETTILETLARRLNKKIGDTVTLTNGTYRADFVIVGYIQTIADYSGVCQMTADGLKKLGYCKPMIGYLRLADPGRKAEIVSALNDELSGKIKAWEGKTASYVEEIDKMIDLIMYAVIAAVYLVSIVFAAVAVSMLCRRSFLQERTDIGIFRAIGFSVRELRLQFAFRFLLIAIPGAVIGSVGAAFGAKPLLSVIMQVVGISRFRAETDLLVFLIPALAICAAFFVFAFCTSRRVRRVSVRALITE
ncbi:MAG: FtsX-like permease family protein [Oscillospiraceae bacterium]|nr:FtsX-like permease family protein [Oscillospiraceae bacterium]